MGLRPTHRDESALLRFIDSKRVTRDFRRSVNLMTTVNFRLPVIHSELWARIELQVDANHLMMQPQVRTWNSGKGTVMAWRQLRMCSCSQILFSTSSSTA